jgi:holo-[acyl-carrier protein] synthase
MIVGVGVELVDAARFEAALDRFGERLLRRVFTPEECAYAERRAQRAQSLAVRFAAKVAALRALGLGGFALRDVEVHREGDGPPRLRLVGRAGRAAHEAGIERMSLSLTHDGTFCLGQVVLEARG